MHQPRNLQQLRDPAEIGRAWRIRGVCAGIQLRSRTEVAEMHESSASLFCRSPWDWAPPGPPASRRYRICCIAEFHTSGATNVGTRRVLVGLADSRIAIHRSRALRCQAEASGGSRFNRSARICATRSKPPNWALKSRLCVAWMTRPTGKEACHV